VVDGAHGIDTNTHSLTLKNYFRLNKK